MCASPPLFQSQRAHALTDDVPFFCSFFFLTRGLPPYLSNVESHSFALCPLPPMIKRLFIGTILYRFSFVWEVLRGERAEDVAQALFTSQIGSLPFLFFSFATARTAERSKVFFSFLRFAVSCLFAMGQHESRPHSPGAPRFMSRLWPSCRLVSAISTVFCTENECVVDDAVSASVSIASTRRGVMRVRGRHLTSLSASP